MRAQPNNAAAVTPNPCGEVPNTIAAGGEIGGKRINPELWQACAGPLVNLPPAGTLVIYFPQGHCEQVAASMKKDIDAQIPNYPSTLPSKLLCILQTITLHADPETDEVYAQLTLQPVPSFDMDALSRSDLALKANKPQPDFFCKTLTASDTSTHGGFSVPRRAADKIFPPLDFSMQPPAQELVARDLHDNVWTFRHIYRGQPKRHLLTTGWSLFVSGKRLIAGDSVLFIRDEKQQLLLGIRRAHRQPTNMSSSVLSSDSMHIGILAAAAHAAANNSPFTVFYNPRASPSEFVIPLAKYYKAVYGSQIALGMRFRMTFETEDSGTRRYMGTITSISDLDPVRWKNSQWRNLQVNWDESTAAEKRNRVSIWEIEPVTAPFFICPPPFFRSKRPRHPGMPDDVSSEIDNLFKRSMPLLGDDISMTDPQALSGLSLVQWMNMQQNPSLANSMQSNFLNSFSGSMFQNPSGADSTGQLGLSTAQIPQPNHFQFNSKRLPQQVQLDQLTKIPSSLNSLGSPMQPQQQLGDLTQHSKQNLINRTVLPSSQVQPQNLIDQALTTNQVQPQLFVQTNGILPPESVQSHQINGNVSHNVQLLQQQQRQYHIMSQSQQQNLLQPPLPDNVAHHLPMANNQIQLQQRHSFVAQQSALPQPSTLNQLQEQQRQLLDGSQRFSRSVASSQLLEMPQAIPTAVSQSNSISEQMTVNCNSINGKFSHPAQQQQTAILSEMPGHMVVPPTSLMTIHQSTAGSGTMTGAAGAGQSRMTDDMPSCSTSPSTNNCSSVGQPPNSISRAHPSRPLKEVMTHLTSALVNPKALETMSSSDTLIKDFNQKPDLNPSLQVSRSQNHGFFTPQAYPDGGSGNMDYLDTSSSTTSVCLSQNDGHLQQNGSSLSYNPQSILRDVGQEGFLPADPRNNIPYRNANSQMMPLNHDPILTKGMVDIRKDFLNNHRSGIMLANDSKDIHPELSSSLVSNSFGVPDMAFDPIDPTIVDSNLLSGSQWAPPPPTAAPQLPRMRTYTKVYKRGAVGRSIDITRYSGYDELKQDLARRFGIEGQLEDGQRVGWKLVYVDHENDVLLVGDDPWEEFVNCVRYIKILSPQEVQQMSLEGDFGNGGIPNQACSSSGGGNA